MITLYWHIGEEISLKLADASKDGCFDLASLQKLTGGTLKEENVFFGDAAMNIRTPGSSDGCFWVRPSFQLREILPYPAFRIESRRPVCDAQRCFIWQIGMLLGWIALMLKKLPVLPVHGTLLEMYDGSGVLLSAASGIGKSTTARRWCAAGGLCHADDMVLLDLSGEQIIAHPLPTWSRCREKLAGEFFPVETAIPLKCVSVLDRAGNGEKEEIRTISSMRMRAVIYFACSLFERQIFPKLPETEQLILAEHFKAAAELLCNKFPPRALFARLDGDLRNALKQFN